jgi:hypothetical protein
LEHATERFLKLAARLSLSGDPFDAILSGLLQIISAARAPVLRGRVVGLIPVCFGPKRHLRMPLPNGSLLLTDDSDSRQEARPRA